MEIGIGKLASFLGLILCVIEIWKPRLSVKLEEIINEEISDYASFQKAYLDKFRQLAKTADQTIKEAAKGPQLQTPEEVKAQALTSLENTKENLLFYRATLINFLVMRPFRVLLIALNKLGRGHAVGGIGIALAIAGTFL